MSVKPITDSLPLSCKGEETILLKQIAQNTQSAAQAARQQLLDEAYDRALQRLTSLDDKAYLELLCTLCSQAVSQSGGELLLNQKDQARCGQELVRMVREKTGAQVTLSQQTASIPGGFILRQGKVEVNCALDAVVRAQAEQTAKDVAAILF